MPGQRWAHGALRRTTSSRQFNGRGMRRIRPESRNSGITRRRQQKLPEKELEQEALYFFRKTDCPKTSRNAIYTWISRKIETGASFQDVKKVLESLDRANEIMLPKRSSQGGARKPIEDEKAAAIILMAKQGNSKANIARVLDVSANTVDKVLNSPYPRKESKVKP